MAAFVHTKLEKGEEVVIGPVRFTSSGSFSFSANGVGGAQVQQRSERRIGITDRRVIIEHSGHPERTRIILNEDVRRVYVRREKFGLKIEKIKTRSGETIKLNIAGIMDESRVFQVFPQAEIGMRKGLFGGFSKITPRPPAVRQRARPPRKSAVKKQPPHPAEAAPATAWSSSGKSHIDDADVQTLEDLRRHYPLPEGYAYEETADGDYVVKRLSDGEQFPILLEAELLTFDVPTPSAKHRKRTIEVFKR